jgi:hypothetical protein
MNTLQLSSCPQCYSCLLLFKDVIMFGIVQPVIVMRSLHLESLYWQGDIIPDPSPLPISLARKNSARGGGGDVSQSGALLHSLAQPMMGLNLTPDAANSLAEIGDDLGEQCVVIPHGMVMLKASAMDVARAQVLGEGGTSKVMNINRKP